MSNFVHLRVHSDYSLGYGVIKIADLGKACVKNEVKAIAISDRYNLFSSLEFSLECKKKAIQPIVGSVMRVAYDTDRYGNAIYGELLFIAKNDQGYKNLLKLSSQSYLNSDDTVHVDLELMKKHSEGLIVLCGTKNSPAAHYFLQNNESKALGYIKKINDIYKDHLYIELIRRENEDEIKLEEFLVKVAYSDLNLPVVATNDVCFLTPEMQTAQDIAICIANNRLELEEERPKACKHSYLKTAQEMEELFSDIPEAIQNTYVIAQRCSVMSEVNEPLLPSYTKDENKELREQAKLGIEEKISHITDNEEREKYYQRLEFELKVIIDMKYPGYFLVVSDFIKWSKQQNIPVGPGRGSGAGSLVAWALSITDCDPLQYGLFFERFLNPERVSMPDFDIDFCQYRRDEVIDYVRKKYGDDRVAHIITFGKLQARAVLRDVARVMAFKGVDRICKMIPNNPAKPVTLQEAIDLDKELQKKAKEEPEVERLFEISLQLEGMNRHVSTHAAGVVIADRSIDQLVPLYKDPASDIPVLQYSMKYAESSGLVKFDFLGLKTLTTISWTLNLIKKEHEEIDISKIPIDDRKTFEMLSIGQSIGVFQFEGSGLRDAMKKMKPDTIEDLIALTSLYRPGPMDNIPSYINRKHGREKPDYIHPKLESVLKETYGIIVYQEQVMQIAQILAGYTLGGADLLRRAMGKKIKSEMDAQQDLFVQGATKNGVDKKRAKEIFELVAKFASYGFNKSHAAAYALIAYQTAYLKANYPVEFLTASINLELDDSTKVSVFCREAKDLGIDVLLPDVNKSEAYFTIENKSIRYGLAALKNVGVAVIEEMVKIRNQEGEFVDIFDFLEKCGTKIVNKRMLEGLIMAGAFDNIHGNRHELFKNVETLIKHTSLLTSEKDRSQGGLFDNFEQEKMNRPHMQQVNEWSYHEKLKYEFDALGFYLSSHPLERYKSKLKRRGIVKSSIISASGSERGSKIKLAGVILAKRIRSSKRGKYAFLQLSDLDGIYEVGVFKESLLAVEGLEVGNTMCFIADVRQDENGTRVIVSDIKTIEDELSNVSGAYVIYIKEKSAIAKVKSAISEHGNMVDICAELGDGSRILYSFANDIRINDNEIDNLREEAGLYIEEK